MDIAALSTVLSQAKVQQTAGIMILDKVMDVAKQNGAAINQLVETTMPTSDPHLGQVVDRYV